MVSFTRRGSCLLYFLSYPRNGKILSDGKVSPGNTGREGTGKREREGKKANKESVNEQVTIGRAKMGLSPPRGRRLGHLPNICWVPLVKEPVRGVDTSLSTCTDLENTLSRET